MSTAEPRNRPRKTRRRIAALALFSSFLLEAFPGEMQAACFGRGQLVERRGGLGGAQPACGGLFLAQSRPNQMEIPARPRLVAPALSPRQQFRGGAEEQTLDGYFDV